MNLSAHLVQTYENQARHVHPNTRPRLSAMDPNDTSWMAGHGPSFISAFGQTQMIGGSGRFSQWSEEKVANLQARLARKLGPEYVTQRPGPGGGPKLSYIEGWKVINLANEVFGFNGWSSSIQSLTTDYLDVNDQGRVSVNVTAIVRITLQDGCWHEDVGCGQGENIKGKGAALDKAKKEAVTDATKRALKTFGNVLGNCLYDREYTKEVVKMRVPPAKFNHSELERRPEFADSPPGLSRPVAPPPPITVQPIQQPPRPRSVGPPPVAPGTPLRSVLEAEETFIEELDAEFMDFEGDSFLNQVDESILGAGAPGPSKRTEVPMHSTPHLPPAPNPQDVPTYQHRHRPDVPVDSSTGGTGQKFGNATTTFTRSRTLPEASPTSNRAMMAEPATVQGHPQTSSGQTRIPSDPPMPKAEPATVAPAKNRMAGPTGASARLAAINSAMSTTIPPRPESPRIPSGGVDAVAAKASTNLRTHSMALDIESPITRGTAAAFNGFGSARTLKRSISGDEQQPPRPAPTSYAASRNYDQAVGPRGGSVSPTKPVAGGQATGHFSRSGPRRALGEITVPAQGEPEWKRPRGP